MAKLVKDLIGTANLEMYQHCTSDTDWVFAYLKSVDASYVALYHQKGNCDAEIGGKQKKSKGNNGSTSSNGSPREDALIVESMTETGKAKSSHIDDTSDNDVMQ